MASGGMMLRLGLAALVSGAAAGMLATLALFIGGLLFGSPGSWWAFAMLADWLPIGFLAGLVIASLPAFFAGSSMWALGDDFPYARHPLAWAAAGAAVGGALWSLFVLMLGTGGAGRLDAMDAALLAAGLVAGAGGALAFLGAMRLSGARQRL
ncbi:MAG TPA: hypothetical protein VE053_12200 [Allosphingosinicella sp.]|nr:hypothetical protein [Allosphingosinicella sp.]